MESPPESVAPRVCPPHYWLIQGPGSRSQCWICKRCGAEHEHRDEEAAPSHQRWYRERIKRQPAADGSPAATDVPSPVAGSPPA